MKRPECSNILIDPDAGAGVLFVVRTKSDPPDPPRHEALANRFRNRFARLMRENDAPAEAFGRMGLEHR